jgi:peptide/nickel transport system permease protein
MFRPIRSRLGALVIRRVLLGIVTLILASLLIFTATQVLPGDAARAIAGRDATPERLSALRQQMHLTDPLVEQYSSWLGRLLRGDLGTSMVSSFPVKRLVVPRVVNSLALMVITLVVAVPISVVLGFLAALYRRRAFDTVTSIIALAFAAVPEFILGIGLILLFSTAVFHWLPPVSIVRPGHSVLERPHILVLPVAALTLAVFPYLFRMSRGLMIDVMESDYVEMALLMGVRRWRIVTIHAFPNVIGPLGQSVALVCAYLAGGVVVVEYVFGFPGIGQGLVNAVTGRDLPVIQAASLMLAAFYVVLNLVADIVSFLTTPRERVPGARS